ncbi:hypothetical protein SEA_CASSITA_64 [Microbacterium phage Cassita]|nr:hypothetical protein SEA_CASSITA_64 [Microbacterium phage Cassita]
MIDNWNAIRALRNLEEQLDPYAKNLVETELANLEYEIEAMECEETHCEDEHGDLIEPGNARRYVYAKLNRIEMGLYREEHDGNLLEVLEEIERILR